MERPGHLIFIEAGHLAPAVRREMQTTSPTGRGRRREADRSIWPWDDCAQRRERGCPSPAPRPEWGYHRSARSELPDKSGESGSPWGPAHPAGGDRRGRPAQPVRHSGQKPPEWRQPACLCTSPTGWGRTLLQTGPQGRAGWERGLSHRRPPLACGNPRGGGRRAGRSKAPPSRGNGPCRLDPQEWYETYCFPHVQNGSGYRNQAAGCPRRHCST